MKKLPLIVLPVFLVAGCHTLPETSTSMTHSRGMDTVSCSKATSVLDTAGMIASLGMKGLYKDGEFKVTIPQHDLHVMVDGFRIIPAMGLGTWAAFTPCGPDAMVMGDLVLTETDLAPVQQEVIRQGLTITAIHNHFVRNTPAVLFMHIDGRGNAVTLAGKVKQIFNKIAELRGGNPAKAPAAAAVENHLDIPVLDSILHAKGELNSGVYKYTLGRPDVRLVEHGIPISSFMGFNTWAAWQGTMDKAAVAGDFTMLETEVAPVMKALIEHGIEVVAMHNHMVEENPKVFFLHYWGVGKAAALATGLRAALDQTGRH